MYLVLEIGLILMGLAGGCCVLCALYGRMLLPDSPAGCWAVIWGRGAGEELEQQVRSLMWLHSCGLLRCSVVVADAGLNADGRALAVRLAGRYPALMLCGRKELEQRMDILCN